MISRISAPRLPFLVFPLFVLMVTVGAIGFATFNVWSNGAETQRALLDTFDRTRAIAAYASELPQLAKNSEISEDNGELYPSAERAIIAAQLSTNFKQLAAAHGLEILRSSDLPPLLEAPLNLVGSSFDLSGSMTNIFALIADTENTKPYLFIDQLSIHSNGVSAEPNAEPVLTATLHLYGAVVSDDTEAKVPVK